MKLKIRQLEPKDEEVLVVWLEYDVTGNLYLVSKKSTDSSSVLEAIISTDETLTLVPGGNLRGIYHAS